MPTLITPIRADNAYFGFGKQSVGGTAVAPTLFPRWMEGSQLEIDLKPEEIWEGDGTRHLAQVIKNQQMTKVKYVGTPRPNEFGFLTQAAMGAGSDAVATTTSTTLSALITAGATTFTIAANTGLTGSGTAALVLTPGGASEEVVTIVTPPTGAGPYTCTVANSGTVKNNHASADPVRSPSLHTLTDQSDGSYFTSEVSLGGTSGLIVRVRDCKVESYKVSAKAGGILMLEVDFIGIASIIQSATSTVTLDQHQSFLYTQGVWTLDGAQTGDALTVDNFSLTAKNNLDTGIQTEQVTLAALIFGNLGVEFQGQIVFQNDTRMGAAFFGGSVAANATDAQAIGLGNVLVLFTQPDGFHTLQLSVPTLAYTKVGTPQPKKDGKAYRQAITGIGTSNQGAQAAVVTITVGNTNNVVYN